MENYTIARNLIQLEVLKGVYSFHDDIFRNKKRFEMIQAQSNGPISFQKLEYVFKGRFICKNDNCKQQMRGKGRKFMDDDLNSYKTEREQNQPWLKWWEKQYKLILAGAKNEKSIKKYEEKPVPTKILYEQVEKQTELKKQEKIQIFKAQVKVQVKEQVKEEKKEVKKQEKQEVKKQNTRWSSSLTYVTLCYKSYPQRLDKLLQAYERPKNNKCQIYFYIELLGQKCNTCESEDYCYPFFGSTELKRMRKNFSTFIHNKILKQTISRFKPCALRRLVDHKSDLCEACQIGTCRKKGSRRS